MRDSVRVGVIGVGSMGRNHVRVYNERPGAELVGITDADEAAAESVADEFDTRTLSTDALLSSVDAVSVCVPTEYHYDVARECIAAGVDVLVEKPFVTDLAEGRELARLARNNGVILQVGHIERFNPAVQTLFDIVEEFEIIAVSTQRLGPPIDREIKDSVVMDLMIHDIDILLTLFGDDPESIAAMGCRDGGYANAQLTFPGELIGTLTASRVTQRKVRELTVTAKECQITVDYIDQSVRIHRQSRPEYTDENGEFRYRHESITERPMVETAEPLKEELEAFIEAVAHRTEPVVTAEDAIRTLRVAEEIEAGAVMRDRSPTEVFPQ